MLLCNEIEISISGRNRQYYRNLKYVCNSGDRITIKIEDLNKNSLLKVKVKCDICDNEKSISYHSYCNSLKNGDYYSCNKCKNTKSINTCKEKYGVENVSQLKEIKEKKKQTNINNWGTENVFQNEEIKTKSRETKLEKYDDEYYTNREKSCETCVKNNGVKYPMQSKKIKETRNKNNKEKYGVEHYTQTKDYVEQVIKTNNEKYDSDWYMETDEFKEKSKITNIELYGVERAICNEEIALKMKETKIKNGHYLSDEQLSSFKKYKNEVTRLTKKVKKELYLNWNGVDYYDGEYIAENLTLKYTDKDFPTIDHKTSVSYGFKNNISAEEISLLSNLCITKRSINSSKGSKNEY